MIKDAVWTALEEIRGDNSSGASTLTTKVIDVFLLYLRTTDRGERCYRDLRALAKALSGCQPGMASVPNAAWMCAEGLKRSAWRGYGAFLQGFRATLAESPHRIAQGALGLFPQRSTVVTLSYSNNVLQTLRAAHAAGGLSEVVLLESRPGMEGEALARELGTLGIPHALLADAAGPQAVGDADLIITGCDALLADGSVVNKVGTLGLGLAGEAFSVPFYCACEALKVDPRHSLETPPPLKEAPPGEPLSKAPQNTSARQPYFDITPARLVRSVAWEDGVVPPGELPRRFKDLTDLLDFYQRLQAPAPATSGPGPGL